MNITGMGTDIERVDRFAQIVENERRLSGLFCENEAAYIKQHKNAAQTACGMYCAKEAFAKALGTGIRGFRVKDIEIAHDDAGAPYIILCGSALKLWGSKNLQFWVSISHTKEYSTAVVIACEQSNKKGPQFL